MDIERGQVWRHKKRGGEYLIVNTHASIQIATDEFREVCALLEEEDWIAYAPVVNPDNLHFRMREEFLDGRFELVKQADQ